MEHLAGNTAQRLEGARMAAQNRRQILMDDEARPDQAAEAEHQGKQPHDPGRRRLVGEDDMGAREVDLRLLVGGVSKRIS